MLNDFFVEFCAVLVWAGSLLTLRKKPPVGRAYGRVSDGLDTLVLTSMSLRGIIYLGNVIIASFFWERFSMLLLRVIVPDILKVSSQNLSPFYRQIIKVNSTPFLPKVSERIVKYVLNFCNPHIWCCVVRGFGIIYKYGNREGSRADSGK